MSHGTRLFQILFGSVLAFSLSVGPTYAQDSGTQPSSDEQVTGAEKAPEAAPAAPADKPHQATESKKPESKPAAQPKTQPAVSQTPAAPTTDYFIFRANKNLAGRDKVQFCFGNEEDIYLPDGSTDYPGQIDNKQGGANFSLPTVTTINKDVGVTVSGTFYIRCEFAKKYFEARGSTCRGLVVKSNCTNWSAGNMVQVPVDSNGLIVSKPTTAAATGTGTGTTVPAGSSK